MCIVYSFAERIFVVVVVVHVLFFLHISYRILDFVKYAVTLLKFVLIQRLHCAFGHAHNPEWAWTPTCFN